MNVATQVSTVHKAYNQLEQEVTKLATDKYIFCMHYHYGLPVISAWITGESSLYAVRFELTGATISKKEGGIFYTDAQVGEMRAIVENWLSSDLHV